jgi:hypothetical protein
MLNVMAKDIAGAQLEVHFDKVPDACPICHRGISAIQEGRAFVSAVTRERDWSGFLEILYRCPQHDCARTFLAIHRQHVQTTGDRSWFFLERLAPAEFQPPEVDEAIANISPNFVKIYGQALEAERLGLDEICGCGLRRAVEFLVKDYLIRKRPDDTDSIKKTFLGTCIENYIADPKIKLCASRATWLGNDETHYERRYDSHDIQNLQDLIRLTMYWIASELLTERYSSELPKKLSKQQQ